MLSIGLKLKSVSGRAYYSSVETHRFVFIALPFHGLEIKLFGLIDVIAPVSNAGFHASCFHTVNVPS